MELFQQQVDEWKRVQAVRLPGVILPCRSCKKDVEIQFDAPEKCPHCAGPFLGRAYGRRIAGLLAVLFVLGLAAFFIYEISRGDSAAKGLVPQGFHFMTLGNEGLSILIIVLAGVMLGFGRYLLGMMVDGIFAIFAPPVKSQSREQWLNYTSKFLLLGGELKKGPDSISVETLIWLRARSLLAPFTKVNSIANVGYMSPERSAFYIYKELPSDSIVSLCNLLWVDAFLYCTCSSWSSSSELKKCASDSPALIDFVRRIIPTEVSRIMSRDGKLLLHWAAEQSREGAPKLSELLMQAKK